MNENLPAAGITAAGFLLPGSAAYDILEAEIQAAEKSRLLLFHYFRRPRFAAFHRALPGDEFMTAMKNNFNTGRIIIDQIPAGQF